MSQDGMVNEYEAGGLSIWAELKATLGDLTKSVQERNRQEASRAVQPSYNRIHATGLIPANGLLVLAFDLAGPTAGFIWNVKTLVAGGLSPTTTTPGRLDIFISAGDLRNSQTLDAIGLAQWRDQSTSLPNIGTYAEGELRLSHPEKLYAVFSGATPGQQVVITGTVQNVQEAANRQATAL